MENFSNFNNSLEPILQNCEFEREIDQTGNAVPVDEPEQSEQPPVPPENILTIAGFNLDMEQARIYKKIDT